ncbi:DUF2779 domain-containing protein [Novosphingobium aerophilum]|uniref:DUF2779 domain-containing protein n=1 Tax=Novosphingobium aerophilum TaxID=2839843 RepID=A0A7X1FAW0_9SPHN|nr:DUF2779 domain-containing protein [Novosphingobium aerophilum]MBC2653607.1 DUF2779 domain-containing protein [Novosphingobium aerophilum]
MRYLTKSRFKLAAECPRKLTYTGKPEYRNTKQDDTFLQSLADGGFQVGELAKRLYPGGIEVTDKGNAEALAETAELLKRDTVTLFEPAIAYGNLLVRADVLVKSGASLKLVEVKSKSFDPTNPQIEGKKGLLAAARPYIEDIAFQDYVIRSAFPDSCVTSYLLFPDKSRQAGLDQMNQLFKIDRSGPRVQVICDPRADLLSPAEALLFELNAAPYIALVHANGIAAPGGTFSLPEAAKRWAEAYAAETPLPAAIGAQCAKCEFKASFGDRLKSGHAECWKEANNWSDGELTEPTILDLWNYRGKQKLMDQGVRRLAEVTQQDIKFTPGAHGLSNSERQWLQIDGLPVEHKAAGFFLDHDYLASEMDNWIYPLNFIDFETATVALPFHRGMRPYESVAFQFSHHVMEADGSLRHESEFLLAEPGSFPNFEFARALKAALSQNEGSVFRWAAHENTILVHILQQLQSRDDAPADKDDLIAFLQTLITGGARAMIDLKALAQKGYFHPSTKGSNSIKKVLPAVLETSTFLKERYAQPLYGAANGIPSKNFKGMAWWSADELGLVQDPYKKLIEAADSEWVEIEASDEDLDIAAGGQATMAYARLQYEALDDATRASLKAKLLRYCELDTLAMAMVVEAWQEALR